MQLLSKLAAFSILLSTTALAEIAIRPYLVSGEVATIENQHATSRTQLSAAQLQALTSWLAGRRSNWRGMLIDATNEPHALEFSLRDGSGNSGSIAVVARHHGGYYLQFLSGSQKWSYRSFGGLIKSWTATQDLSAEDLNQLRRAVSLP
jgi:hypothetical protein